MRQLICGGGLILASIVAAAPVRATVIPASGAVTTFSVPATGFYDIEAVGGSGGSLNFNGSGGSAAAIEDTFSLTAGETLTIAVGGSPSTAVYSGGGGGGTYVVAPGNVPLLVAGGGGGAALYVNGGSADPTAAPGNGSGGNGGFEPASYAGGGGGGGGFTGNGSDGKTDFGSQGGGGGDSFTNGSTRGSSGNPFNGSSSNGGFGGGGGGGNGGGGGGGGGYTGGAGGDGGSGSTAAASAGTSFDASSTRLVLPNHTGSGSVTISPAAMVQFFAQDSDTPKVDGSLRIDPLTGAVLVADLFVTGVNADFNTVAVQAADDGSYTLELTASNNTAEALELTIPGDTTLAGFTGSPDVVGVVQSGFSLQPLGSFALEAPEPSSLAMLVFAVAAFARGRRRRDLAAADATEGRSLR